MMGGTYNEPNTNLTSAETTIRNFVHGSGFQRDVLGAAPATAWQLDVFGHDPQFPGMAADAGLTSSSWARGPHHQWGRCTATPGWPACSSAANSSGSRRRGAAAHPLHARTLFGGLVDGRVGVAGRSRAGHLPVVRGAQAGRAHPQRAVAGRHRLHPPNKWVTAIHRDWAARYTWPRFVCALPGSFSPRCAPSWTPTAWRPRRKPAT
ncbi:glycosyl hydrolases family 38 N-terminal domain protein [Mycobacterium xenopi 4042]|uniref:Glycosyl hydrolases family 38 N-terminal domain protein n=1 Tax=Mycobacterium xenopi 4042 TaxID=1299334 RepID=X8EEU2_MYCXE|nr:glycosyl hydrolases family 38 N-terminal domain protein [Mycobacterium xenopi 4042]